MDIFVSVGTGLSPEQEAFVSAVEHRLVAIGLTPHTVGRNTFSADAPLRAVSDLMDTCVGTVVIALERFYFSHGQERPGSNRQDDLVDVRMPTAWNQIEAAMAYSRRLPLLVIVDPSLRKDGLLERGNDWYVQELPIEPSSLNSVEFSGILDSWRRRLSTSISTPVSPAQKFDPSSISIGELIASLKPGQFWATLGSVVSALGISFALGANLFR